MQKTRRQILDILKRESSAALETLAREIGLSPVTIRAHLSILERDGLIVSEEVRGKVGRPHFVYSLTDQAQVHFPVLDHTVAHRFLEALRLMSGPEQMNLLVERVADRWAAEKSDRLANKGLEERVAEVTRIRNEEGAMAVWERHDGGYYIRQYHCPASRVAQSHPEICDAELGYMRRLLGASVEREASGQGCERKCSYRINC